MSIPDELMWTYYLLLLHKTEAEIAAMKKAVAENKAHPMDLKKQMAHAIIARFWGNKEANAAQENFKNNCSKKKIIPTHKNFPYQLA